LYRFNVLEQLEIFIDVESILILSHRLSLFGTRVKLEEE